MKKKSEKLNILLVRSDSGSETVGLRSLTFTEPLELEYLSAGIPDQRIMILDLQAGGGFENTLREFNPHVIGFTGYITSVNRIRKYAEAAKKFNPHCLTVAGGIHATAFPEDFFSPFIDIIVTGEGVEIFRLITEAYPDREQMKEIRGIFVRNQDDEFISTGDGDPLLNPDLLPFPDRQITGESRKNYYYLYYKPTALIRSSLSCSHRCAFCVCHKHNRGCYAARSIRNFTDELKTIAENNVYIIDNDFLFNRDRLLEFVQVCESEGIRKRYICFGRSDFIAHNPDVIEKLSKTGLEAVIVGLEFFDDGHLKDMKKKHTIEENIESMKVLRRFHIDPMASFIIPHDCGEDYFSKLLNFIYKNEIYDIVLQTLTPLPGTELYDQWKDNLLTHDRDLFDMSHVIVPYNIDRSKVYQGIREVYVKTIFNFNRMKNLRLRINLSPTDPHYFRLLGGAVKYLRDLKRAEGG